MQGWFSNSYDFIPNANLYPVYVGTHFAQATQKFIKSFMARFPHYFNDKSVGCRDRFTLDFCKRYKIDSYLSRCLTLTLDKRSEDSKADKVFFVSVPKKLMRFFPKDLLKNAEFINQQWVNLNDSHYDYAKDKAQNLLNRYKNEAKLIITTALHCASPCTAMGIPVVFIRTNDEQKTRFSALDNIIKIHTPDELKNGTIDFAPAPPNIENLKRAMIENLRLSICQESGESIDLRQLAEVREFIDKFKADTLAKI